MPAPNEHTELLYQALAEPIGLLIEVALTDRERLRQKLYQARVSAKDPALAILQFRASPLGEGDLIIVKETIGGQAPPLLPGPEEFQL